MTSNVVEQFIHNLSIFYWGVAPMWLGDIGNHSGRPQQWQTQWEKKAASMSDTFTFKYLSVPQSHTVTLSTAVSHLDGERKPRYVDQLRQLERDDPHLFPPGVLTDIVECDLVIALQYEYHRPYICIVFYPTRSECLPGEPGHLWTAHDRMAS